MAYDTKASPAPVMDKKAETPEEKAAKQVALAKKLKGLKPEEKLAEVLASPAIDAAAEGAQNPDQAKQDIQGLASDYFEGHEAKLMAYFDAMQKVEEAKLAASEKPTSAQTKAVEAAAAKAAGAFKDVEAIMDKSPNAPTNKEGAPAFDALKAKVAKVAQAYGTAEAAAKREGRLNEVKEELTKDTSKGYFWQDRIPDLIVKIGKSGADPKDRDKAIAKLQKMIAKKYPEFNEKDTKTIADMFISNAATQAAKIEEANPVHKMTDSAIEQAKKEASNLPATLLKEAVTSATTGLPPGVATLASRVTGR